MDTPKLQGKNVVVYGLAKSGLSAIRLLLREGAKVTALDKATREELGEVADRLDREGVKRVGVAHAAEVLRQADLVVVSPGVPLALPELRAAQAEEVTVWGEVELAWRFLPRAPFIGITGTNGKSTTTALCGQLFESGRKRVFVGGNLGLPLSEAALAQERWGAYVVELSSFQLEGARTLRCTGAAVLNLTPDHLDRYETHADYAAAKERIFAHQQQGDFAVVNADDEGVLALARRSAKVPVYGFTLRDEASARSAGLAGLAVPHQGGFRFAIRGHEDERYTVANRALRGAHNLQNAMAAALCARLAGLEPRAIEAGLAEYPGLAHRLESVATIDGVEWVNDSKATNVDSSVVALNAFGGGVWLILGGKGKGAPYQPLVDAARGKVRGVLTIGADAKAIEQAFSGALPVYPCGTLDGAIERARSLAKEGEVVLLSPACASYDQFKNFEQRGDAFKMRVRGLTR